jgi:AhpD family alkylhydroperoxidase
MQPRINLGKTAPELYETVINLDRLAGEHVLTAGIADGFTHLLRLRASQLNGCAYCVRLHTRDALQAGESSDRVSVLPAWRETTYFSPRERAALALCEALTLIADGQVPDHVYEEAAQILTEFQISAVEWLAVATNAWNRIATASRYPVRPSR